MVTPLMKYFLQILEKLFSHLLQILQQVAEKFFFAPYAACFYFPFVRRRYKSCMMFARSGTCFALAAC
jgi:hypothetical protein